MRSPPRYRYRILYVGDDYALSHALRDRLADLPCQVVRCPASGGLFVARIFIEAKIPYALFLFDEALAGSSGEELARFALSLPHRAGTPTLIVKEAGDAAALAEGVRRLLGEGD
jgi:hypothetical protein